jgi:DNA-binding CsgD family transcriptional regulator/tetratricopeptide (TPR) repeat protein
MMGQIAPKSATASGGLVGGSAGAFVGRAAELAGFEEIIAAAGVGVGSGGGARVVIVPGEPGIGKTALLRQVAAGAARRGWTVRWGGGTPFERPAPFGLLGGVLDEQLRCAGANTLGADELTLLRRIVTPTREGGGDVDHQRVQSALRTLLEQTVEPPGLLLVLDDLHAADEDSTRWCESLLRRRPRVPLVVAMAYRPRQLPARIAAVLAGAVRDGHVDTVELGALTFEEARPLMAAEPDRWAQLRRYEASGGNPCYLTACTRAEPAPALAAELASLAPPHRLVAHAAAVAGVRFEPELVADIAEIDLALVLAALDVLVHRDLVRPGPTEGRLQFRHPLVRRAAYESSGAGWRLAAHGRAASSLARRGASTLRRAPHLAQAATGGDPEALDVLVHAASAMMGAAPRIAARWLDAALRRLPAEPWHAAYRMRLLAARARALSASGRLLESRDLVHEIIPLLPGEPTNVRARTVAVAARVERLLGRHREARALLRAELDSVDHQGRHAVAELKLELAAVSMMDPVSFGDPGPSDDAVAAARSAGDDLMLAAALAVWVLSAPVTTTTCTDTGERRLACLREAAELVDASIDGELSYQIEAAVWLGWAELSGDRLDVAGRHLDRALRLVARTGQHHVLPELLLARGVVAGRTGRLVEAGELFAQALTSAHATGRNQLRAAARAGRDWIAAAQGDVRHGTGRLGTGRLGTGRLGTGRLGIGRQETGRSGMGRLGIGRDAPTVDRHGALASALLAEAYLAWGDPAGGGALLTASCGGPSVADLDPTSQPRRYRLLASAEAGRGNTAEAQRWARRAGTVADRLGLPAAAGPARLAHAVAALAGDPAAAATLATDAALALDDSGDRLDAGHALLVAGRAYAALGKLDLAREHFALARARFEECGAAQYLADAAREERRMNARQPRRRRTGTTGGAPTNGTTGRGTTGSGLTGTGPTSGVATPAGMAAAGGAPAPLTRREGEVAALVARGMSNRQIAAELHLSPRTVEAHLSSTFAKLGVTTRVELVCAMATGPHLESRP